MDLGADLVRRIVKLAVAFWVLRWAAQELAAYSGRHWQRPGPPPRESEHAPGWMPGPSERKLRENAGP